MSVIVHYQGKLCGKVSDCSSRPAVRAMCRAVPERNAASNVIVAPQKQTKDTSSCRKSLNRKEQLEKKMKQLLEQDDGWHSEPLSENMIQISTPKQFKSVVLGLSQDSIVLADFFSPQCHACRSMWPKLKQIAESNPDVTFALINTASKPMLEMAEGFKVSKLPWFIIFEGGTGKQLASFTANISTISTLRAELAAAKACTDPMCEADWSAHDGVAEVEILQET